MCVSEAIHRRSGRSALAGIGGASLLLPLPLLVLIVLFLGSAAGLPADASRASSDELFRQTVAPLLEAKCLRCHNAEDKKGKLSLATHAEALAGGKRGPAFVPGEPAESQILDLVRGEKPKMPKDSSPLSAAEVEAIERWIAAGAPWPEERVLAEKASGPSDWWSLRRLVSPAVPSLIGGWARTPVDAFVLERLQEQGIEPSAEADRRTLIRRLSFDLRGLPPSPKEVDDFLTDPSPDSYDRLADRLLASPRHGERWARHWLDVVHYGDTHGFDKDKVRPHAWPYRDYVIAALNADKPYARFVEEQVAGDVLHPDDPEGVVATGFIAAGPWDFVGQTELREGTFDKMVTRSLDRDDMVATAMSTFTSLTVHCARCHEHKFDPIGQSDYYALQAVFAGVDRGDRNYDPDPELHRRRRRLAADEARLARELHALEASAAAVTSPEIEALDRRTKALEERLRTLVAPKDSDLSATLGYHSAIMKSPEHAKWAQVDLDAVIPIDRIVLFPAHVKYGGHPGPGFGFPPRFRVEISEDPAFTQSEAVLDATAADFPHPGDAAVVIDATGRRARYVRVTATRLWERTSDWIFALAELAVVVDGRNIAAGKPVESLDTVEAPPGWARDHLTDSSTSLRKLGEVSSWIPAAAEASRLAADRQTLLAERTALAASLVQPAGRETLVRLREELAVVRAQLSQLPAPQGKVYAAVKTPDRRPREVQVLARGNVRTPIAPAQPGALACVSGIEPRFALEDPEDEGSRRAALARWLTSADNPLTWRSIVNRAWHYHFGRGIAETPNDFGRMGSEPTHPELLDWLAVRFRDRGGSLKYLHRLVVTSAAYRQSAAERAEAAALDGSNRFLWRMSRRRLDAEELRDAALAASGTLDLVMGGPAVQHFAFKDDHSPIYDYTRFDPSDPRGFRRSVYRFVVRSVPDPFLECLDCADPSALTPKRNTTLTAAQALALLNNPFMVRQAQLFAARVCREASAPELEVDRAFALALGRLPAEEERRELAAYTRRHGVENLCRLILNLNEFVFVE
jgi:mono/diheme cytochrome c family protein